jgi:small-conductance mechanosensitive channel
LSSAILYLGIVVIWACVLIPRWLRRDASRAPSASERSWDEVGYSEEWGPSAGLEDGVFTVDERPTLAPPPDSREDARRRVLKARRRMLSMLLLLAFGAGLLAVTSFAAWWVMVPPVVMLFGYLVLLREAAAVDAERTAARAAETAEARAATRRAMEIARARAAAAAQARENAPDAQIIDISAQIGEEFYDQYAEARLRAVGD